MRSICAPGALLKIVFALACERDKSEISRLKLEPLAPEFVGATLTPRYHAAGFDVIEYSAVSPSEWSQLPTSWARRLAGNDERTVTYLIARAATLTEMSRRV
jgi:hypothetical protein